MLNIHITSLTFEGTCAHCGKHETRTIPYKKYVRIQQGDELIQNILPDNEGYTPAFREFFCASDMCDDCWKKLEEECEREEALYEQEQQNKNKENNEEVHSEVG